MVEVIVEVVEEVEEVVVVVLLASSPSLSRIHLRRERRVRGTCPSSTSVTCTIRYLQNHKSSTFGWKSSNLKGVRKPRLPRPKDMMGGTEV